MSRKEYITVVKEWDDELDGAVNEMLNNGDGWQLQGGVAVCHWHNPDGLDPESRSGMKYAQALVREVPEEAPPRDE